MCCRARRMGMISSRQSVLRRTSATAGQSRRSWGSKAIRIGRLLEDSLVKAAQTADFSEKPLRKLTIFEEHFCQKPGENEIQTRFPTDTSEAYSHPGGHRTSNMLD